MYCTVKKHFYTLVYYFIWFQLNWLFTTMFSSVNFSWVLHRTVNRFLSRSALEWICYDSFYAPESVLLFWLKHVLRSTPVNILALRWADWKSPCGFHCWHNLCGGSHSGCNHAIYPQLRALWKTSSCRWGNRKGWKCVKIHCSPESGCSVILWWNDKL